MKLDEAIHEARAVFFDLFHTLFTVNPNNAPGKSTGLMLGIPEKVWTDLLFDSSRKRMCGLQNDKYDIIRDLAHSYNPNIPEESIRAAADCREQRFTSGLSNAGKDRVQMLSSLRAAGKKIGLISNADSVEIAGWKDSPLAEHFDSVIFSYADFTISHLDQLIPS